MKVDRRMWDTDAMATTRSDDALASLLLTQRLIDVDARPLSSRDYWQLIDLEPEPSRLLRQDPREFTGHHGLPREWAERLERLLSAGTALAVELEALEQQGHHALCPFDDAYPERLLRLLGQAAPPVLYAAGPTRLLGEPGIAVVGSRNVSDAGAEVAGRVARLAAERGLTVVSGGAKGTDQLAMNAATEADGTVVGVLADGLDRRVRQPDVRRAISREQVCLASPYKPSAGFSVANAMARNKVIYALARTTLVVAADVEQGGTWAGAVEALGRSYGDVAVWTGAGAGEGNAPLVERGARPISDPRELLRPPEEPPEPSEQLRLRV